MQAHDLDQSLKDGAGKHLLTKIGPSPSSDDLDHLAHMMGYVGLLVTQPVCEHPEGRNAAGFTSVAWHLVRHTVGA